MKKGDDLMELFPPRGLPEIIFIHQYVGGEIPPIMKSNPAILYQRCRDLEDNSTCICLKKTAVSAAMQPTEHVERIERVLRR